MIALLLVVTLLSFVLMIVESIGERSWPRDTFPAFFWSLFFLLAFITL
jgi:hypothetical protein